MQHPAPIHTPLVAAALCVATLLLFAPGARAADDTPVDELVPRARAAAQAGQLDTALKLATQAVTAEPNHAEARAIRASIHEAMGNLNLALHDLDALIRLVPESAKLRNHRGELRFFLADINGSIEDFDRAIALDPDSAPYHWQRGISLYYAGRYADGAAQFESHRKVNPDDVENAAWHYLCKARAESPAAAAKDLIPIDTDRDTRVPMKQVFDLFAGKGTEQAVLDAAEGDTSPRALLNHRMYAHLYLGLWHEANGRADEAKRHMKLAAVDYKVDHYMGRVAQVHWKLMQQRDKAATPEASPDKKADDAGK